MFTFIRYAYPLRRLSCRQLRDLPFHRSFCSQLHPARNVNKVASNPGVTAEQFRALFRPAEGKMRQPRYKLRWDWHLRNFLTALIPPAAMLVFFKLVALLDKPHIQIYETRFEGTDPITGKQSTLQSPAEDLSPDEPSRTAEQQKEEELHVFLQKMLQDRLKPLEEELERLQLLTSELIRKATESAEASHRVEKARQLSKTIVRPTANNDAHELGAEGP